jgi:hypothetical protein
MTFNGILLSLLSSMHGMHTNAHNNSLPNVAIILATIPLYHTGGRDEASGRIRGSKGPDIVRISEADSDKVADCAHNKQ